MRMRYGELATTARSRWMASDEPASPTTSAKSSQTLETIKMAKGRAINTNEQMRRIRCASFRRLALSPGPLATHPAFHAGPPSSRTRTRRNGSTSVTSPTD